MVGGGEGGMEGGGGGGDLGVWEGMLLWVS